MTSLVCSFGGGSSFRPEFFMPCSSLACGHVFSWSWWFMFVTCHGGSCLLHVMVVHVFSWSWLFMSFTCHGGSWFLTFHGVFHVFPNHGGPCF